MDKVLSFLADYYIWFMVAAGILLFALIGFIVDGKKKKKKEEVIPTTPSEMPSAPDAGSTPMETTLPITDENNDEQKLVIEEPTMSSEAIQNATVEPTAPTLDAMAANTTAQPDSIFTVPEADYITQSTVVNPTVDSTPVTPTAEVQPTLVIPEEPVVAPSEPVLPEAPISTIPETPVAPEVPTNTQNIQ